MPKKKSWKKQVRDRVTGEIQNHGYFISRVIQHGELFEISSGLRYVGLLNYHRSSDSRTMTHNADVREDSLVARHPTPLECIQKYVDAML